MVIRRRKVPTSKRDVQALQRAIAVNIARIEAVTLQTNAEIAKIHAQRDRSIEALKVSVFQAASLIHAYAEPRKAMLTDDGKTMTIELGDSGSIAWRTSPPSVLIDDTASVLWHIKRLKFVKLFVRIKREINKQAMLTHPNKARKIPGVSIDQVAKFIIRTASPARVEKTLDDNEWDIVWPKVTAKE